MPAIVVTIGVDGGFCVLWVTLLTARRTETVKQIENDFSARRKFPERLRVRTAGFVQELPFGVAESYHGCALWASQKN